MRPVTGSERVVELMPTLARFCSLGVGLTSALTSQQFPKSVARGDVTCHNARIAMRDAYEF